MPTDQKPAWLQYRFGPLGKPELVLPQNKKGSLAEFAHEFHHGLQTLQIDSKVASYMLASIVNAETEEMTLGLYVQAGEQTVFLRCKEAAPPFRFHELVSNLEAVRRE